MNMAVMALSPKPAPPALSLAPLPSFFRYFLLNRTDRIMPHMMQMLMSKAMVEKPEAVIWLADNSAMPTCSAAACATWVS